MDDVKRARIHRCQNCWEHWRNCRAWNWPHCAAGGLGENGEPLIILDNDYMEGPPTNCLEGHWERLDPMPPPPPRHTLDERADYFIIMNEPMLQRIDPADRADVLTEMIAVGLPQELAEKVGEKLGLSLDEELREAPT